MYSAVATACKNSIGEIQGKRKADKRTHPAAEPPELAAGGR